MKIDVTIKSFDGNFKQFDFLIPSIRHTMEALVDKLIALSEPLINVDGLNTIHFTEDYKSELFEFQQSVGQSTFVTNNKIADGQAQVVTVKDSQGKSTDAVYHIFISKSITMIVIVGLYIENNKLEEADEQLADIISLKNSFIRKIRHELAHVEDHNNLCKCNWIEELLQKKDLLNQLRFVGYRFWEEYYACKRSSYYFDTKIIMDEFNVLLSDLEDAEKEICQQKNKFISNEMGVGDFLSSMHEYIESAYILCCYFIGHYDIIYDSFKPKINSFSAPIRFYPHILELWEAIHVVEKSYPNWDNPSIFDSFVKIITDTMESFEVYPKDIDKDQSVSIGMNPITTKREETASKSI